MQKAGDLTALAEAVPAVSLWLMVADSQPAKKDAFRLMGRIYAVCRSPLPASALSQDRKCHESFNHRLK
ncbi:hypothetical protein J6590_054841 [Homalodisca vitripennis]|nr:hypothetical protein J6590_054841 [Homalodisca vitripennis]